MKALDRHFPHVGNTPLVYLPMLSPREDIKIFAKIESENPTGSHKDRLVSHILKKTKELGLLDGVRTLVEASSGNTAASVAYMAKQHGLESIIFVPASTSKDKTDIAEKYGAKIIHVSENFPYSGCTDYMDASKKYAENTTNCYLINQYNSPWNTDAHYHGLGREIAAHFTDNVDVFVSVASTGGTISGVGRYLKEINPDVRIILADPVGSIYHQAFQGKRNPALQKSAIEGAGKSSLTKNIDFSVIDEARLFTDREAFDMAQTLAQKYGMSVGGTGGANALIASQLAHEMNSAATIVTIFPDSGKKYASQFSDPEWIEKLGNHSPITA